MSDDDDAHKHKQHRCAARVFIIPSVFDPIRVRCDCVSIETHTLVMNTNS